MLLSVPLLLALGVPAQQLLWEGPGPGEGSVLIRV